MVVGCVWGSLFIGSFVIKGLDLVWDVPAFIAVPLLVIFGVFFGLIGGIGAAEDLETWDAHDRRDAVLGWGAVALLIATVAVIVVIQEV